MMLRLGLLITGAVAASPSFAQSPCEQFAWPLKREQAAFSSSTLPVVQSGGASIEPAGVTLALQPSDTIKFPITPEKASKPGTFGGFVRISVSHPGIYQVTLSEEAWIDVSQDDRAGLKSTAHSGRKGCPDMRKSVRFNLNAGSTLVQISNSPVRSIKLALVAAES